MKYILIFFLVLSCAEARKTKKPTTVTEHDFKGVQLRFDVEARHLGQRATLVILADLQGYWYIYDKGRWFEFWYNDEYRGIDKYLTSHETVWISKYNYPHSKNVDLHYGYVIGNEVYINQFHGMVFSDR